MYGIILASIWHGLGFYMALMLAGLKSINPEIWSAARLDGVSFWRLYIEIIIPMMKFTFLTCAILLSLGVVKAYDIVVAMTNGGPGTSTWTPAYFAINAYSTRSNIGFAERRGGDHAADHAGDLPAAGVDHLLAGPPPRGSRGMTAAADIARPRAALFPAPPAQAARLACRDLRLPLDGRGLHGDPALRGDRDLVQAAARDHARADLRAAAGTGRCSPGTRRGTRSAPGSPATASSRASSTR